MEIGERVAQLETKIETALSGVANFRAFQAEASDFFSRYDEREKQHNRRSNWLIGMMSVVLALATVALVLEGLHR